MAGIETLIINLREAGFLLILLWLLTLAIVYGILSHVAIPKSKPTQGIISIVSAFLVLLAAAGGPAAIFISNLLTVSIVLAFGLLIAVIFLEVTGIPSGKEVFGKHPRFFAAIILVLLALIFIGAGGLGILNIPAINISSPVAAIVFFLIVMVAAIFVLLKEGAK